MACSLRNPSQPRIRAPQSASTSLRIGPLRAARIGPVKKVQTVPTMAQQEGPALVPRRMTVRGHCRIVWNAYLVATCEVQ